MRIQQRLLLRTEGLHDFSAGFMESIGASKAFVWTLEQVWFVVGWFEIW